jgi:hypothetical protein
MLSLCCATHTYKSGTHTPYGILAERFEDGNTLFMSVQAVRFGTSPSYINNAWKWSLRVNCRLCVSIGVRYEVHILLFSIFDKSRKTSFSVRVKVEFTIVKLHCSIIYH